MTMPALTNFFMMAAEDDRINNLHICVYMALFQCWHLNGFQNPVQITRRQIMRMAKVGRTTYHKCINDLKAFSIINYIPSYHPVLGSLVCINELNILPERDSGAAGGRPDSDKAVKRG